MIEKIFIGEVLGEDRVARPVKGIARSVLGDELAHPDMQVSVGAEDQRLAELGADNRANTQDKDQNSDRGLAHKN